MTNVYNKTFTSENNLNYLIFSEWGANFYTELLQFTADEIVRWSNSAGQKVLRKWKANLNLKTTFSVKMRDKQQQTYIVSNNGECLYIVRLCYSWITYPAGHKLPLL